MERFDVTFAGHTITSVLRMLSVDASADEAKWLLPETKMRFDAQHQRLQKRKQGLYD